MLKICVDFKEKSTIFAWCIGIKSINYVEAIFDF